MTSGWHPPKWAIHVAFKVTLPRAVQVSVWRTGGQLHWLPCSQVCAFAKFNTIASNVEHEMHYILRSVVGLELTRISSIAPANNCEPAAPLLNIQRTECLRMFQKTRTRMCTAAGLETIQMPNAQMDTLWCFHIWEYYVATRMNNLQQCKWISPKKMSQSKVTC